MSDCYYAIKREDCDKLSDLVTTYFSEAEDQGDTESMSYANGIQDCLYHIFNTERLAQFMSALEETNFTKAEDSEECVSRKSDVLDLSDLVAELFMEGKSKKNTAVMSYANGIQDCLCNVYNIGSFAWFRGKVKETLECAKADLISEDGEVLQKVSPEIKDEPSEPHDHIDLLRFILDCEKHGYKEHTDVRSSISDNVMYVDIIVNNVSIDIYELDMFEPLSWKKFVQITDAIRLQMFTYYIDGQDFDVLPETLRGKVGRAKLNEMESHAIRHPGEDIRNESGSVIFLPTL